MNRVNSNTKNHSHLSTFLVSLSVFVLASGCQSKNTAPATSHKGQETAAQAAKDVDDKADKKQVNGPPTADMLATYLEGLGDKGTIKATIKTSMGSMTCDLDEKNAPLTVTNFVGLARGLHPFKDTKTGEWVKRPFYNGLIFHRVIPQFMIQGGDPMGSGQGGPGYKFATEVSDQIGHSKAGSLAMANAGPNTNGSQFYITEQPVPRLDGGYNVFGFCDNIDVVKKIARAPKAGGSRPKEDVVIESIEITRG